MRLENAYLGGILAHSHIEYIVQLYENAKSVVEDNEYEKTKNLLFRRVDEVGFSARTRNCLRNNDVRTIMSLVSINSKADFLRYKNAGKKSLAEVRDFFIKHELSFGMDVNKYLIEN